MHSFWRQKGIEAKVHCTLLKGLFEEDHQAAWIPLGMKTAMDVPDTAVLCAEVREQLFLHSSTNISSISSDEIF